MCITIRLHGVRVRANEAVRREAHYRELAHTDPLTGLANRRAFAETLRTDVIGGEPCMLLAIDLDGFKNINDLRGHDIGDAVLVEVARRLRTSLRERDIAARLGGDEFAVVLWMTCEEATAAAGRLCEVLARPYEVDTTTARLSASIGLASADGVADSAGLMRRADLALRFAKLRGKDRVEGYAEAFVGWLRRRTAIEAELRGAIRRGDLTVLYQPVVSLPSGAVVGAEALLRWHHPDFGAVSPTEFIPIAEDAGLIDDIGRWMLGEVCRQLSVWMMDGPGLWISVDASAREVRRPDYADTVAEMLRTHHVPAKLLVIEVTEHSVALGADSLSAPLAALRATGVRIALDDFGAGYSSLGRLRRLPVDIIKIDSAITAPSTGSDRRAQDAGALDAGPLADGDPLAEIVVRLGERLGLTVIADGVGDEEQRGLVVEAGCALAQGGLFGPPMPAEHLEALVESQAIPMPRAAAGSSMRKHSDA